MVNSKASKNGQRVRWVTTQGFGEELPCVRIRLRGNIYNDKEDSKHNRFLAFTVYVRKAQSEVLK